MASTEIAEMKEILPQLLKHKNMWSDYDKEADTLYIHFKKPNHADHTELTDDDIIIRSEKGEIIGLTILHASARGLK